MKTVLVKRIVASAVTCVTLMSGMAFSNPAQSVKPVISDFSMTRTYNSGHQCGRIRSYRVTKTLDHVEMGGGRFTVYYKVTTECYCPYCGKVFYTTVTIQKGETGVNITF